MGTVYSDTVTNNRASPITKNSAAVQSGKFRIAKGEIAVATGDIDDDDIVVMLRVPSNAVIWELVLYNDDLDSNGSPTLAFDIGLYTTAGVVKDRDFYALAATTLQSANVAGVDLRCEAANITTLGDAVYTNAGDAEGAETYYDIAITLETVAATAAAGDIVLVAKYTVD